jgi:hypothetical protein
MSAIAYFLPKAASLLSTQPGHSRRTLHRISASSDTTISAASSLMHILCGRT